MLSIETLRSDQYRQVAEWEFGPQPDNTDWEQYEREMSEPKWWHYGLYLGDEFVGCVSLEKHSRNIAEFHVVTARRKVQPQSLARVLFDIAGYLFRQRFVAVVAHAPIDKRAVARLAIRCGMKEWGHSSAVRYFMTTKQRYQQHEWFQAPAD